MPANHEVQKITLVPKFFTAVEQSFLALFLIARFVASCFSQRLTLGQLKSEPTQAFCALLRPQHRDQTAGGDMKCYVNAPIY